MRSTGTPATDFRAVHGFSACHVPEQLLSSPGHAGCRLSLSNSRPLTQSILYSLPLRPPPFPRDPSLLPSNPHLIPHRPPSNAPVPAQHAAISKPLNHIRGRIPRCSPVPSDSYLRTQTSTLDHGGTTAANRRHHLQYEEEDVASR